MIVLSVGGSDLVLGREAVCGAGHVSWGNRVNASLQCSKLRVHPAPCVHEILSVYLKFVCI